jgi:predicted secreted Zn-dependent protease
MHKQLFFCRLFILFAAGYFSQDTALVWSEKMVFGWQYYTGRMPDWKKNTMAVASTCYDLSVEFPDTMTVRVEAHFHADCSWVLPDFKTPDILAHEKLHFDIVELFARRLRKKISEAVFANTADARTKIKKWHAETEKAMDRFQDRYDKETDGSMNAAMQKRWNDKVFLELNALKFYSGCVMKINFKQN